jgi:hypothetical protein
VFCATLSLKVFIEHLCLSEELFDGFGFSARRKSYTLLGQNRLHGIHGFLNFRILLRAVWTRSLLLRGLITHRFLH